MKRTPVVESEKVARIGKLVAKRLVVKLDMILRMYYLRDENINPKKGCLSPYDIGAYYSDDKALTKKQMKHLFTCDSCMTEYTQLKRDMETDWDKVEFKLPETINKITEKRLQEHLSK